MKENKTNVQVWQIDKPEEITVPKIIEELNKQPLYIPPSEDWETYDSEAERDEIFLKSEKVIGQYEPITVAVWFDDPNKDSTNSQERVHLRVVNGRHRYLQVPNWKRRYIKVNSVKQYWTYRLHIDTRKRDNPEEQKKIFRWIGEQLMKQGCPKKDIAKTICKEFPQIPAQRILRYVPLEFKDLTKVLARLGKINQRKEKTLAEKLQQDLANPKEQENKRLHDELTGISKENLELKEHIATKEIQNREDSSRLRILEQLEQIFEIDGIKIKIKLEKGGTKYIVSKVTE